MRDEKHRARLAANPFPESPWVRVTEEGIIIKAGYSDALHRMLRWVPRVEWVPQKRHWKVPLAGAELIRSVLPEISRFAEATHEESTEARASQDRQVAPELAPAKAESLVGAEPGGQQNATARDLFRDSARLLFGTDWQRDTARALGRDEATLACWLVGEAVREDDPWVLLQEMLDLMRQRAATITAAADALEAMLSGQTQGREHTP
jgi:hypothetical protein